MLAKFLTHPLTRGLDIDAPETTQFCRQIIKSKPFLRKIYEEWYDMILKEACELRVPGHMLELGSGGGFFSEYTRDIITNDIFVVSGLGMMMHAHWFPLKDGSLGTFQ